MLKSARLMDGVTRPARGEIARAGRPKPAGASPDGARVDGPTGRRPAGAKPGAAPAATAPSAAAVPQLRPVLLIAFGALLGFGAATVMRFYESAPAPAPVAVAAIEVVAAMPPPIPAVEPAEPVPLPFALLGGQEGPNDQALFCSIWVTNPSGCGFEAVLRAGEAAPPPAPLPALASFASPMGYPEGTAWDR